MLGLWEIVPEDGNEKKERMMILKFSETEYIIHYPVGEDAMYFRAYPIKPGGESCVQLQAIGTHEGPPSEGEKNLYHVASYRLENEKLEIRLLNEELVDDELKTSETLTHSFLKQRQNKKLFVHPGTFRRVEK